MATFTLRRFSNPEALRAIRQPTLLELLHPYTDYFSNRGLEITHCGKREISYTALTDILMRPDDHVPRGLVDDLYFVHEMATAHGMDVLLRAISREGIALELADDPTPAEVAAVARLRVPLVLERTHAELLVTRRRAFEYFQSRPGVSTEFEFPDAETLTTLEKHLNTGFARLKRGRGAKVFVFERPEEVWFLVRHGRTYKREGAITEHGSEIVYYRPEVHDVLRYNPTTGELCANAETKTICAMYRELFGYILFGSRNFFPGMNTYTLDPILRDGEGTMVCSDVPGMDWVRLSELAFYWGGPEGELEVRRANDLFAAFRRRGWSATSCAPGKARLTRASFTVKFKSCSTPRSVSIRPSNIACFTRDADASVVEQWMLKRGFSEKARHNDDQLELDLANPRT